VRGDAIGDLLPSALAVAPQPDPHRRGRARPRGSHARTSGPGLRAGMDRRPHRRQQRRRAAPRVGGDARRRA
jgi:hypothetical protein